MKPIKNPETTHGVIPPQAVELEDAVLGALMIDSNALVQVVPVLRPEVFYKKKNQLVCKAILSLVEKAAPVDILTVAEELKKLDALETVGGAYAISQLTNAVASGANAHYHYRVLLEKFFKRQIIRIGMEGASKGYDDTEDVFDLYDWIQGELEEIEMHIGSSSFMDTKSVFEETLKIITNKEDKTTFYPIGDPGIDNTLMISPGELLNISGKSGSGKTSFVTYLAQSLLKRYPKKVAICWYSMEDSASKIMMNFISPTVKLTNAQLHGKNYKLSKEEFASVELASREFQSYDIEFFTKPAFISHIKAHFQRFCATRPDKFCILIIDNVMLLKDNGAYRFKSRGVEVDDHIAGQIQNAFTSTKNDYDINIWFLHHLTKEQLAKSNFVEGYRPREDQIKGSTRLRDVATQGILIHRPGDGFPDITKHYKETDYEGPISKLMIGEVFKNRDGHTGFFRYFANLDYKIFFPI
jgi:replicative DNA helicase